MNKQQIPKITLYCTTCGKKSQATKDQLDNAKEVGVAFSACCNAVAVVVKAEVKA